MSNKKSDRVYNKDRIQRIKDASEKAKQNDPNWHIDAPQSIIPDEDDMPLTKMKTPPFLKEPEPNSNNSDNILSKKLTLSELTQLNKDSSQLHDIMHSTNYYKGSKKDETKPVNYLELSRMKKVKERDNLNRKTAESLDQASEIWHNQLKEYGKNKNTQDSTGLKSSLFSDGNNNYDKSEHEKNEKRSGNRRFSSEFINKLDLLLQRGTRSSKMFTNLGSLRNINERSFNRWSSRFDKFSSMWDLRYPLLSNSLGATIHSNHFSPDPSQLSFKPESKFHSHRNLFNDYNEPYNLSSQYNPLLNNINSTPNVNPLFQSMPSIGYPANYNSSNLNLYSMNDIPRQSSAADQNMFLNSYNPQPQFPQTPLWQNPFQQQQFPQQQFQQQQLQQPQLQQQPFQQQQFQQQPFQQQPAQQTYFNSVPMSLNNYPSNYIPPSQEKTSQSNFHSVPNINAKNEDMSSSFESVTRKIDILAEKLEDLNVSLDKLKTEKARQGVKSIIKTHKNVSISSDSGMLTTGYGKMANPISQQPSNNVCNCPDCNSSKPIISSFQLDRRVRFDPVDKEIKDPDRSEITSCDSIANTADISTVSTEKESSKMFPKAVHPRSIEQKYRNNSRLSNQFQKFQLPQEFSNILHSNFKRSNNS